MGTDLFGLQDLKLFSGKHRFNMVIEMTIQISLPKLKSIVTKQGYGEHERTDQLALPSK